MSTNEVIERALRAATRAPSPHNSQPWRFVVAAPVVEVHLDREGVLPVTDPGAREARVTGTRPATPEQLTLADAVERSGSLRRPLWTTRSTGIRSSRASRPEVTHRATTRTPDSPCSTSC